ncbi:helix-turn-helix domain-containing protein [Thalassospira lucentensis]|uniref:helix-turn-helix domain-containing protein n=1 Tax=Thalassospira lucentensis TaxID=168935 RepID=UPI003D2EF6F8
MIVLPVPMVVALLLGFLFLRATLFSNTPRLLAALLLACACQSVTVSVVQYYGVSELRLLQPITASFIPALAWVAFLDGGIRSRRHATDLLHFLVPVGIACAIIAAPIVIDALLVVVFVGYGSAILVMLHRQGNDLAHARLASGHVPALVWRAIAIALIASAISDVCISLALSFGYDSAPGLILSIFSSIALLTIGFLSLSPDIASDPRDEIEDGPASSMGVMHPVPPISKASDDVPVADIMGQLETLIADKKLYLDPDLTLARLARRLGYPLKQVSTAINAATGENVSRYINKYRIEHACRELEAGQNITTAMLASGFNTKSNFNREFLRITGKTPSQWPQQPSSGSL